MILFVVSAKETKKVGFTATKKIGNAVVRNRAKRRLRALFLEFSSNIKDGLYIFVAKDQLLQSDYNSLKNDFQKALSRLKVLDV